ncbi:hypothetical protein [Streptomyces sp. AP-93]|uniref:hypothetical protein n=1 Tax=Streptomyces sp. AP-93 TaxID=2929048 RepID=UPI001FAE9668|nr:hypothetical protein [Streptomyces sp. AP-93]MCJ0875650.1 hypothetical protein [Streptomyces sp. AP-93]
MSTPTFRTAGPDGGETPSGAMRDRAADLTSPGSHFQRIHASEAADLARDAHSLADRAVRYAAELEAATPSRSTAGTAHTLLQQATALALAAVRLDTGRETAAAFTARDHEPLAREQP